uniref:NR LBD domain-containing protein n=1 Tax=Ditylenchus dipsaci TaxID=166011 RepID=A0A915D263_9BILA
MVDDNSSSSCSSDVGNFFSEIEKNCKTIGAVDTASQPSSSSTANTVPQITTLDEKLPRTCALYPANNILRIFVEEEMRIAERRRIMFCERPVGSLLGRSKACPFSVHDIKPLRFRDFRKSIRTHILLIYEWLRVWPQHSTLTMEDQITFLRKCVLYHTILDPCFITMQIGDLTKFVLPNGGYVSTIAGCDEGWQDEKEISRDIKKRGSNQIGYMRGA